jgi:phosphate transport system substrate-binding protein
MAVVGVLMLVACGPAKTPTATNPGAGAPSGVAQPLAARQAPAGGAAPASVSLPPLDPSTVPAVSGPLAGEAQALTGAGATFPAVLYSKWFNEYETVTRVQVNYQAIGSGGGIKSISDQTVDFGATDGPMTDEQIKGAKGGEILHVPTALGAVAVTYNLPSLGDALRLTPETLAGIYLGEITRWNDPKLVADNPALAQVNQNIVVVHRSDGSGTSYIFTDYLSAVSPTWKQKVGAGTSVEWPTGLGGKGNEGVAGEVKQNPYAIGYVEQIYAIQNKLGVAQIKNLAGNFVEPSVEAVTAAAADFADRVPEDLRASIVNAPGRDDYPIAGFTWLLAYQNQTDRAKATALTRMLWWAVTEGQKYNAALGYAPLPPNIADRAEQQILSISVGGQRALPVQ